MKRAVSSRRKPRRIFFTAAFTINALSNEAEYMTAPDHRSSHSKNSLALGSGPYMCGELLLIARLNNSPTHKKRPKAPAKPKAAGLSVGGASKSPRSADGRPRR
jgi:hypothetical protein